MPKVKTKPKGKIETNTHLVILKNADYILHNINTNNIIPKPEISEIQYRRPRMGVFQKNYTKAYLTAINNRRVNLIATWMENHPISTFSGGTFDDIAIKINKNFKMVGNHLYTDFSLEQVTQGHRSREQLLDMFTDTYVNFFGESPLILMLRGTLLDTEDFPWADLFTQLYKDVLNGPSLIKAHGKALIGWNYELYEGYILGYTKIEDAHTPGKQPFTMDFLVTKKYTLEASTKVYTTKQQKELSTQSDFELTLSDLTISGTEITKKDKKKVSAWAKLGKKLMGDAISMGSGMAFQMANPSNWNTQSLAAIGKNAGKNATNKALSTAYSTNIGELTGIEKLNSISVGNLASSLTQLISDPNTWKSQVQNVEQLLGGLWPDYATNQGVTNTSTNAANKMIDADHKK